MRQRKRLPRKLRPRRLRRKRLAARSAAAKGRDLKFFYVAFPSVRRGMLFLSKKFPTNSFALFIICARSKVAAKKAAAEKAAAKKVAAKKVPVKKRSPRRRLPRKLRPKRFRRKGLGARSAALIFPPRQTPDFHPIFACLILRQISLGSPAQFFRASPLLICGISQAFLTRVGRARRRAFFVSPIFEDAFRSFQWERITATKWKNCGKLRILKRIAGVRFIAGVNLL